MKPYYNFKPEDAFNLASQNQFIVKRRRDELIFLICPYCHGETKNGKPDKETFSVNLRTGAFNCKRSSCGVKGSFWQLAKDLKFSLGEDVDAYYDHAKRKRFKTLPQTKIDVRDPAIKYLESRGIPEDITREYEITTWKEKDNIIVFPFKDENGKMVMAKYRDINFKNGGSGNKEWTTENTMPILFGMNHCSLDYDYLVITEGQIDSLSCAAAGVMNAVSVPHGQSGSTWIPYCWNWMHRFQTIIVFGDHENGKITLVDMIAERFQGTIKHVRPEDYKDCKDANEILQKYGKEAVKHAVEKAIPNEVEYIKPLWEVKRRHLSDSDRIDTGLRELDNRLRGFYFGQLIVLTGVKGRGKSTLASQFAMFAIAQKINTFIYSGEMQDYQVQGWIERQIAGAENCETVVRPYSTLPEYFVKDEAVEDVARFYMDRAYIYGNTVLNGNDEAATLTKIIPKAISQYNCKFIMLDNLMTAISGDLNADENKLQTQFIKEIARIAKTYSVIVVLVAHPRKTSSNPKYQTQFTNDDIAGSANITNLADVVLRYDEGPTQEEKDESPRRIWTLKSRDTGLLDHKGFPVWYEDSSKRISDKKDDFNFNFDKYKKKSFGDSDSELPEGFDFVTDEEEKEIPF